jgi:hypothetical protein
MDGGNFLDPFSGNKHKNIKLLRLVMADISLGYKICEEIINSILRTEVQKNDARVKNGSEGNDTGCG